MQNRRDVACLEKCYFDIYRLDISVGGERDRIILLFL